MRWKYFWNHLDLFKGSNGPILGPKLSFLDPNALKIEKSLGKHSKKWMILGLLTQLFKAVKMKIFLRSFGPILGSKWTYLGSKICIFGTECSKKWNISGKQSQKSIELCALQVAEDDGRDEPSEPEILDFDSPQCDSPL